MNKKNLGRITALGIAALTAVPTFSIVASAAISVSVNDAWRVQTGYDNLNQPTYVYYADETKAKAITTTFINANGVEVTYGSTATRVTSINGINAGATIYYDNTTSMIYATDAAGRTAATWRGTTGSTSNPSTGSGSVYYISRYNQATDYTYFSTATLLYYPNAQAFRADPANSGLTTPTAIPISIGKYSASTPYFNYLRGEYEAAYNSATNVLSSGYNGSSGVYGQYVVPSGYRYASNTSYYSPETATWYPNLEALRAAVGYTTTNYTTKTPATAYSSTYSYFNPVTGDYVSTTANYPYAVAVSYGSATTGRYTVYYSSYTGRYYDTLSAANAATPSGYTVRTITNSAYTASYLNTYSNYYGLYDYTNPYYYYYGLGGYYGLGDYGFSTSTKDTSKVTIGNLKGWTSVIRTINSAKAGASYTVNMNTETEITENVLKALKGKNVNINFKFSNGAIFTLNGSDITSTSAISPTIRYGSTSIPSTLKKKAVKANDGVSSSQLTINGGSFGASASITVKFNSKRSGCSAKLYRYNASDNTLSLVSRSAVQGNGQCQFDNVKQGGEYIVVLS